MKHLPKHLRPRWRYLFVGIEAWPDAAIGRRDFQRSVWFAAQNLLGDATSADADLRVLAYTFEGGVGEAVVRVRRAYVEEGRAALACVDSVRDDPVGIAVRGVSGTVRAGEERYLGRAGQNLAEIEVVFRNATRRAVPRDDGDLVDVALDGGFVGATRSDLE